MAIEISSADIDSFCKKLEQFSGGLSDSERTLFKSMLDKEGLSDQALGEVRGGAAALSKAVSFQSFAPKLDASYFRIMSW